MINAIEQERRIGRNVDQAAGLRRLFAPAAVPVLPLLVQRGGRAETPWLARLGEAFARAGQQTLLIDASRAQIAAILGLRARFDLQHALEGDCRLTEVQLDAAPGLTVVPAARACERALAEGIDLPALLAPLLAKATDIVVLLLPAGLAPLIADGEVLVPVLATRDSVAGAAAQIGEAAGRQGTLAFRLLFLGMEKVAAATLGQRMSESIGPRLPGALRHGAVAALPRDLACVVAAAGDMSLARISPPRRRTGAGETR